MFFVIFVIVLQAYCTETNPTQSDTKPIPLSIEDLLNTLSTRLISRFSTRAIQDRDIILKRHKIHHSLRLVADELIDYNSVKHLGRVQA